MLTRQRFAGHKIVLGQLSNKSVLGTDLLRMVPRRTGIAWSVPEKDVLGRWLRAWPINATYRYEWLVALYHRRIPLSCSSSVFLRRIDLPLSLTRWPHLRFSSFSRAFGSFLSFANPVALSSHAGSYYHA